MPNLRAIPKEKALTAASFSRFAPRVISNLLVGLIIFFSATQLGLHFWPNSTLVYGIRIDYLSPTIYFLDCLILLFLGSDLLRKSWLAAKMFSRPRLAGETRSDPQSIFENLRIWDLRLLVPPLLTNLLFSANPLSTLSWSLHLILYLSFISTLKFENWRIYDLRLILTLSLLFQTILALAQVALGHSLGGLMYYLGERTVSVGAPSVATASLGATILRAYGTFGHPNVLAGFAVISLLIVLVLRRKQNKFENLRIYDLRLFIPLLLTTTLVCLTQSRSAALALFGLVLPFCLLHFLRPRLIYFAILFSLVIGHWSLVIPARNDLSFTQRLSLQQISLQVIRSFPLFGTGANASISTYPTIAPNFRLLQPDHNSFTLLLSWFGLFGVLAILSSLRPHFTTLRLYDLRLFAPLLPLLLLDHYLLTSPQGLFILLLYLKVVSH
ncbi:MAG: O-antigen ligase family protein [bacterium]